MQGCRAVAIACGDSHCACVTTSGDVYTWGAAAYGKLGLGDAAASGAADVGTPSLVPGLRGKRFVDVACGAHCTLALTDGGLLFSWGAHSVVAAPPQRVRVGGMGCGLAAGGGHYALALGEYPPVVAADVALAKSVGFEPAATRAHLPAAVASELGPLSTLVEARVPADADPSRVMREVHELRALLAHEEARRDACNSQLMALQQQLQQVLIDEEMLRERRGGVEPPDQPPCAPRPTPPPATTTPQQLTPECEMMMMRRRAPRCSAARARVRLRATRDPRLPAARAGPLCSLGRVLTASLVVCVLQAVQGAGAGR